MRDAANSRGDSRLGCPAERSEASPCGAGALAPTRLWVAQRFSAANQHLPRDGFSL
jgi:hypothetical protein